MRRRRPIPIGSLEAAAMATAMGRSAQGAAQRGELTWIMGGPQLSARNCRDRRGRSHLRKPAGSAIGPLVANASQLQTLERRRMLASLIIVFREAMEAGLVVGVV